MRKQQLFIIFKDTIHKCILDPSKKTKYIIGASNENDISFGSLNKTLTIQFDKEVNNWQVSGVPLNGDQPSLIDEVYFYFSEIYETKVFDTSTKYTITIGKETYNDLSIGQMEVDLLLTREQIGKSFLLNVIKGKVFHNFSQISNSVVLEVGDQLYFDGVMIRVGKDDIQVNVSEDRLNCKLSSLIQSDHEFSEDYPDYHRSPRIIYRAPEDRILIAKPSNKPTKPSENLAKILIAPISMIVITIILMIFQPRGLYILMSLGMTFITVGTSIVSYLKNRSQYKEDILNRDTTYNQYLKDRTTELHSLSLEQIHSLEYHYPNVTKIREMAVNIHSRIYEKTMFHHDFLMYRVGLGKEKTSFEIDFKEDEFSLEKDELIEMARTIRNNYHFIEDVPVVTNLMNGPVGYIGHRTLVIEQLQLMVMQLALFHSYYDLQFITLFPEEEKEQWEWMRWLPHATLQEINVRGFVYHERSRDQVLNSMYQILKARKQALEEKGKTQEKMYFSPHYVVLITDEKIILDHILMEFFNEDTSAIGVSLIFVQDVMQSLPEHVKTVIDIRDYQSGNIILEKGELVNRHFTLNHFPKEFDKESISRALAPLNHLQNLKNSIPESVTFLEMFGIEEVEKLDVGTRWKKNETYKSLAVPLGLRGKDDIVNLNLHEKAHGPHGLVAGTTGSGKSEIIQSYILSLAVNFHPYEVAFLLIDYKGGGMANLFKELPHLLGAITNLDGAQSMRALASIKAELQKRQRLFGEYEVNHINQYQKLFKAGEVKEAMPHLFLISDEFAELKSEQPEFMKELVSTARIGRSLGIHLILATQKPSGVVDDQIWSNSKFKLALKVQNASDSNEIIKTADAADITLPGRAYLQVGNNEIYELFQSAWSGANYLPNKEDVEAIDTTIYAINELGQYEILSEDLSGLEKKEEVTKIPSELDAVIQYIHDYTDSNGIEALPRPWLPPLPEQIYAQDLLQVNYKQAWAEPKKPLRATIGLLDQPEFQAQNPLTLDLTKDGHLAVFSSPGYGKSTFLQSVVMDLARQHNPEQLHIYLVDMGTNGLLPLKYLPHIADTFMVEEEIKITKFIRRIGNEIKERKKKLSLYGVASIEMYEKASQEEVPNIIIVIDNIDSLSDLPFKENFEKMMAQVAREGASVGVHMLISAGRQNALKLQIISNIKNQIALYMIDQQEPKNIVGRTDLSIEELPGRGMVKVDNPTVFQTLLSVKGEDTLQIIEGIQEEGRNQSETWKGKRPEPIPMVPEVLANSHFSKWPKVEELIQTKNIPFAVDFEEVLPITLDYVKDQTILIVSDQDTSLQRTFQILIENTLISQNIDLAIFDNKTGDFSHYKSNVNLFGNDQQTLEEMVNKVKSLFESRQDVFRELQEESKGEISLQLFVQEARPVIFYIPDIANVLNGMNNTVEDTLANLIENSYRQGIYFVIGGKPNALGRSYDAVSTVIKKQTVGISLVRLMDQGVLEVVNKPYKEPLLLPYEAYYIRQGQAEKIKIVAPL